MFNLPLRVGLIGCGGIAPTHLRAYQRSGMAQVVAVADVDARRAAALAEQADATAYENYLDMLEKERLDAVSVLTPPAWHRAITEVALAAGVHVLCEKPLATTAVDARAMAEAAQRSGRLLVAQCHRFHEPVRRARDLIQAGDLGELLTYRNRFSYLRGTPDEITRGRGGVLLDNGSHASYIFRFLLGEVESAFGWARAEQLSRIEDLCVCTLILESAATAGVIELDGAAKPCPNVIEVFGDKGAIVIDYDTGKSRFHPASGEPVSLDDPTLPSGHRFDREVAHFLHCILGDEEPTIGAEEGVTDLLVLEACYQSMTTGRKVHLEQSR
ncbi:MAG: Gfo/Idh/MocA family oxidoreductase [Abditibacteriales bacterium]|nr:Gfo/Idh/MocA family oxidoreductase [Abditibacteriales bacterium]MDW8364315.1 Gfo/Idh/MocA family oxidoreductase [Abditibacteriales bacterium]